MVVNFLSVQRNGALGLLTDTKQGFHNVGTLCPHQTGNPQDFAFVQVEGDIADGRLTQRGEIAHFKNHFTRLVLFVREALVEGAANHHGDDLVHIQTFQRLRGNPLAVAQDGNLIAQLEDLFHFVGDIHNAAAAIF